MRVLYLDDIPTPYRLGIHRAFALSGEIRYKVLFCAAEEPGRQWEPDYSGIEYTILNGWQYRPPGQVNPFSFKLNPGVLKELNRFQPDVVIVSGYIHPTVWLAAAWCRCRNIPYGLTSESNAVTGSSNALTGWMKKRLVRPLVSGAAFGLPVSRSAGEYLRKLSGNEQLALFPFPNTPDISHIINITEAAGDAIRSKVDLTAKDVPSTGRHILFAGRLIEAKRPLDLLRAYQLLPTQQRKNVHLVFAGDGPLRREILSALQEGDSVYLLGWIKDTETMIRLMAGVDLFVLPSGHEPWGAVVNEAMAAGTPVLASDRVGAARDMITHGHNGFLFPCGDISTLSRLLGKVLSDLQSPEMEKIIAASQKTAELFGHEYAKDNLRKAVRYGAERIGKQPPGV